MKSAAFSPLVSVITPFFNEEKFLSEAIESVIQQEYDTWELFLVDDGSSDGSTAMAKKYAEQYPGKIIYTEHDNHINKGLSASRNAGIAKSKGELVAFLDADDVWLKEKLKMQVEIFQHHSEIAMICEASNYWYSWNNNERADEKIEVGVQQDKIYSPPQLSVKLYPLGTGDAPCPTSIMIKKAALEKYGAFEESFRGKHQAYEDQPFLAKIYLHEKVFVSSNCNNMYRIRAGSLSEIAASEGHYNQVRLHFLNWLMHYLKKEQIKYPAVHWLLRKAFMQYKFPGMVKLFWKLRSKYHQMTQSKAV